MIFNEINCLKWFQRWATCLIFVTFFLEHFDVKELILGVIIKKFYPIFLIGYFAVFISWPYIILLFVRPKLLKKVLIWRIWKLLKSFCTKFFFLIHHSEMKKKNLSNYFNWEVSAESAKKFISCIIFQSKVYFLFGEL